MCVCRNCEGGQADTALSFKGALVREGRARAWHGFYHSERTWLRMARRSGDWACSQEKWRVCSLWAGLSNREERSGGKRLGKVSRGPKDEMREVSLRKALPWMDFWWPGAQRWRISDSDILQPVSVCLRTCYSSSPCFSRTIKVRVHQVTVLMQVGCAHGTGPNTPEARRDWESEPG